MDSLPCNKSSEDTHARIVFALFCSYSQPLIFFVKMFILCFVSVYATVCFVAKLIAIASDSYKNDVNPSLWHFCTFPENVTTHSICEGIVVVQYLSKLVRY